MLDGLRGIAILMVVWWHLWLFSWLSPYFVLFGHQLNAIVLPATGLMGVELFFFISGFVLFYPYARHLFEDAPLQTVKEFAYRRFIKIVPSYVIAVLFALPLVWADFSSVRDAVWQVVSHLLFIHIFWMDTWVGINGVLWSLGVEVQFYVIFPLLCWAFRRQPLITYLAMLIVAMAYRLAVAHCCIANFVVMGQLPAYLDLFANGMLAAWVFVYLRSRVSDIERKHWIGTLVAIAAGFLLYAMLSNLYTKLYIPTGYAAWQAANRSYFGALLGVFTVASCFSYSWWRELLANRITVFLAAISYNLYLWHQVIFLYMLKHRIPPPSTPDPHYDNYWKWVYCAAGLAVVIGVSTFITYAIERPLLKRGFRAITDLFAKRQAPPAAATQGAGDG